MNVRVTYCENLFGYKMSESISRSLSAKLWMLGRPRNQSRHAKGKLKRFCK